MSLIIGESHAHFGRGVRRRGCAEERRDRDSRGGHGDLGRLVDSENVGGSGAGARARQLEYRARTGRAGTVTCICGGAGRGWYGRSSICSLRVEGRVRAVSTVSRLVFYFKSR
jgi:hypothetical protein